MRPSTRSLAHLVLPFLLALLGLAIAALPAAADGFIIPQPPIDHPRPVPWREIPLAIKYHHVDVTIVDQVATTHVDQVFVNEAGFPVEGTYIFPLPEDAAISSFDMWVDGKKLEGKLLGREEARAIYEDIVRRQRDPALLEYVGRGAFQASIFPIPPGGERRIELTYGQVLSQAGGLVHYRYPLNTEKFSSRPLGEVSVTVQVEDKSPLRAIYSASHQVDVLRDGERRATISYEAKNVRPDRDFDLYYSLSPDAIAVNLLSYKPYDEDGFFLLLVTPPVEAAQDAVVDKDVVLVMDTSGSMAGEKLDQAKAAANYVLSHLGEGDHFNIVAFSTATRLFASEPVAQDRRAAGERFIKDLRAQGSTDINRALMEALAGANPDRPTIVIFLTDGLPTTGEVNPDRIVANVTANTATSVRLFAFGVGYDVDTVLLDQLSSGQRGASAYVKPGQAIDEEVSGFYAKVSSPVLVDIGVSFSGVTVDDIYPYPLPDLFAGTQLVVAGRYRDGAAASLNLTGAVNGQPQSYTYDDLQFVKRGGDDFIARLWAQRKIGYLLAQIRLHGANDELVKEVVALSTRYGIVTPYTSFLVQEPQMALTDEGRNQLSRDLQMPAPTAAPAAAGAPAAPAAAPSLMGGARSGEKAVERSVAEQGLAASEQAAAPAADQIKQVGDRTFLFHDGAWLDTRFDQNKMKAEAVVFGSERYFQLVGQYPDVGRYLALGDRVTVILDGHAYAIGPDGQSVPVPGLAPTSLPTPAQGALPAVTAAPATAAPRAQTTARPVSTPAGVAQSVTAAPPDNPVPTVPANTAPGLPTPCVGAALVGLVAAGLPLWSRRRHSSL